MWSILAPPKVIAFRWVATPNIPFTIKNKNNKKKNHDFFLGLLKPTITVSQKSFPTTANMTR